MHIAPGTGLPAMRSRLERKIQEAPALPNNLRLKALNALARMPEGDRLCHGDFHPDNVIETPTGPVIIDWVDVTSGAPLADVARTALLVRHGSLPSGNPLMLLLNVMRKSFYNAYLNRYFELAPGSPAEVEAWLPIVAAARMSEGITSEDTTLRSIAARLDNQ
jgi:Ser/Thr protein kinase RdoA (MazF antagonist)